MHQDFKAEFPQVIPALNETPKEVFQPPLLFIRSSNIKFLGFPFYLQLF